MDKFTLPQKQRKVHLLGKLCMLSYVADSYVFRWAIDITGKQHGILASAHHLQIPLRSAGRCYATDLQHRSRLGQEHRHGLLCFSFFCSMCLLLFEFLEDLCS